MLDYRYLKAFFYTVQFKSFSKAANELKIAQSAVSRQIKLLEESLKTDLILRSSKELILTEKGQELYRLINEFDYKWNSVFEIEKKYRIRIGILHGLLENWILGALVEYYRHHDHQVDLTVETVSELKQKLVANEFDFILTNEYIQTGPFTGLKLFEEKLVLVSSRKLKTPVNVEALKDERLIVYDEDDPLLHWVKHSERRIKVNSITAMLKFVRAGLGVAIIPDHLLQKQDEGLHVYPIPRAKKSWIYLVSLNYQKMPEHLAEFVSRVKKLL